MVESILTLPPDANPLLKRAMMFLESGDFASATEYCGKVLDAEPENPFAFIVHLMAKKNLKDETQLAFVFDLKEDQDFKFARRFASPELAAKLDALVAAVERNERLKPLRAASAERQQTLSNLLARGLTPELAAEAQQQIAAEQQLMQAPAEDAAASVAAATNALAAKIGALLRLAALEKQMEELLPNKGVSLSEEQAQKLTERIAAVKTLMARPAPDPQAMDAEIKACQAVLNEAKKGKSRFIGLVIAGVVLIVLAAAISFFFWHFVEPHMAK